MNHKEMCEATQSTRNRPTWTNFVEDYYENLQNISEMVDLDIGTFSIEVALERDNFVKWFTIRDEIDNTTVWLAPTPGHSWAHMRLCVCSVDNSVAHIARYLGRAA
jgi:hypothetical protein